MTRNSDVVEPAEGVARDFQRDRTEPVDAARPTSAGSDFARVERDHVRSRLFPNFDWHAYDAFSPLKVLGRGYAVCWNADRTRAIRTADETAAGDRVRVTLGRGELDCDVRGTSTTAEGMQMPKEERG